MSSVAKERGLRGRTDKRRRALLALRFAVAATDAAAADVEEAEARFLATPYVVAEAKC